MKYLFLVVILLSVFSCKKADLQYRNGNQLLTLNDVELDGSTFKSPEIAILSPDTVLVGEELFARIFINHSDLNIINAFVDCKSVSIPRVDTSTYSVSGCSKALIVESDTVFIGLKPTRAGTFDFSEITILTQDRAKIFRTFTYSFQYTVVSE